MTALNTFSDLDKLFVGVKRFLFLFFNILFSGFLIFAMLPVRLSEKQQTWAIWESFIYHKMGTISGLSWLIFILTVSGILFKVIAVQQFCWGSFRPTSMVNMIEQNKESIVDVHRITHSNDDLSRFLERSYNDMMSYGNSKLVIKNPELRGLLDTYTIHYNWSRQFGGAMRITFNVGLVFLILSMFSLNIWFFVIFLIEALIVLMLKWSIKKSLSLLVEIYWMYFSNVFFIGELEKDTQNNNIEEIDKKLERGFVKNNRLLKAQNLIVTWRDWVKIKYGKLDSQRISKIFQQNRVRTDVQKMAGNRLNIKKLLVTITGTELLLNIIKEYLRSQIKKSKHSNK